MCRTERCWSMSRLFTRLALALSVSLVSAVALTESAVAQPQAGSFSSESSNSSEDTTQGADSTGVEKLDLSVLLNPQVESASLVAEPLSEAPAPITVITADMIEAIGARNLKEALTTYVPGMTAVEDRNEQNVAMRGIFTSSQQKILVMLNGHRLNSRTFSSAPPDFSIGIDPSKVKQIEVVRGPGSAVYGNLALNGVINIVTKSPDELDGVDTSLGVGNYGQQKANATYGQQLTDDSSILMWGQYFRSKGKDVALPDDEVFNSPTSIEEIYFEDEDDEPLRNPKARIMGFADPPSFDAGLQFEIGDFTVLGDVRQGKYIPPFTSGGNNTGEAYNYDKYRTWNTVGPGLGSFSGHFELSYDRELGEQVGLSSSTYFDTNRTQQHLVRQQASKAQTAIGWFERTIGNITQMTFAYDMGPVGSGDLAVGMQIDHMDVIDSYWVAGSDGDFSTVSDQHKNTVDEADIQLLPAVPTGEETIYSGFSQLKHKFGYNEDIIANLGVRYDIKDRYRGDNIDEVSPRTALIFGPESTFGAKFSYSESFVDAPFWYRYNTVPNFRGRAGLKPERMSAFQLTPTLRLLDGKLRNTVNFFHANHTNIIFQNRTLDYDEPKFDNSGQLTIAGVEEEIAYLERDYRIRANATWQTPLRHTRYEVTGSTIDNVPHVFFNVILDGKPLWFAGQDNVWLSLASRYYSEQHSPYFLRWSRPPTGLGMVDVPPKIYDGRDNVVDDYLLLRSSLRWRQILGTNFRLQFTVNNILNTTYYQGGTTAHPYRQPGRWYLFSAGYDFDI